MVFVFVSWFKDSSVNIGFIYVSALGCDLGDLNIKGVTYKHKGLRSYLPGLSMWSEGV